MGSGFLVFCEHENGSFKKTAFELLAKANSLAGTLGGDVSAVVIGNADAASLGGYGAARVYTATGADFEQYSTCAWVKALAAAVSECNPSTVLGPASQ